MTRYPDHSSPVRKARETARAALPCRDCGSGGEPVLRSPRPYSVCWEEEKGSYFACPGCGRKLSELKGSAATRSSDVPRDRLPEPSGLVRRVILPALEKEARGGPEAGGLAEAVLRVAKRIAEAHGLTLREGLTPSCASIGAPAVCLTWQGRPWLALLIRTSEHSGDQMDRIEDRILTTPGVEAVVRIELIESQAGLRPVTTLKPGQAAPEL